MSVLQPELAAVGRIQVESIRREASNTGYYEKERIAEKYGITCPYLYGILQHHHWAD